jgi:ribosomal protein S15P/S13E
MTEEDYTSVIASYQQKAFELFNKNIVLETQVNSLTKTINSLTSQIEQYELRDIDLGKN